MTVLGRRWAWAGLAAAARRQSSAVARTARDFWGIQGNFMLTSKGGLLVGRWNRSGGYQLEAGERACSLAWFPAGHVRHCHCRAGDCSLFRYEAGRVWAPWVKAA